MIAATWTVDPGDPIFEGHFPGQPIVPGVAILDFALREIERQASGALAGWRIASVKFVAPAQPGDTLTCAIAARDGSFQFEVRSPVALVAAGRVEAVRLSPPAP